MFIVNPSGTRHCLVVLVAYPHQRLWSNWQRSFFYQQRSSSVLHCYSWWSLDLLWPRFGFRILVEWLWPVGEEGHQILFSFQIYSGTSLSLMWGLASLRFGVKLLVLRWAWDTVVYHDWPWFEGGCPGTFFYHLMCFGLQKLTYVI